ncbi:type II secretion system F family protein [Endozoicomonas gorgoniicola]|uniref:Type II secretion system F family protein n=1 Tax=Endozoicomonas gorgoniicola TaxID=1234144 RepID=A0ABT3MXX9_9GAMM|nr:type II secretion system F family protein [Endozoicomonas gorgoniicola]MCW7554214.1 type II secretion system F family protein [Endozoicomonas gorgoniicola]
MAKTEKQYTFIWKGKDRSGNKQSGEEAGVSANAVKKALRGRGINVSSVSKKLELFSSEKKVKGSDIATMTRQMATMLKCGVPMLDTFELMAEGASNPSIKKILRTLHEDVASGMSFNEALQRQPKYFDTLYCSLVQSGESSGKLDDMLEQLALYREKSESTKKKVKKALTYPVTILVIAGAVTVLLLVKVVPSFESVFSGMGGELPAPTRMVVAMSEYMQANWLFMVATIAAVVFGVKTLCERNRNAARNRDWLVLRLPVIGTILEKSAIARFARTLSTNFAAGVPMIEALDVVAGATGNIIYEEACQKIKHEISGGTALNIAVRNQALFPPLTVQMLKIGDETGAVDELLKNVASIYEEDVDTLVDGLSSMIEPMIMAFLGVVVGGLIIALYLPIFEMGNQV